MGYPSLFGDSTTDTTYDLGVSTSLGLPSDPSSSLPPAGLESTVNAVPPAPKISTAQSWWGGIKSDMNAGFSWVEGEFHSAASAVEDAPGEVYGVAKKAVSTVYTDVESGVSTVVNDVAHPIGSLLTTSYWYLIGAVVAVAAALYFVGKGGVVGQAKPL